MRVVLNSVKWLVCGAVGGAGAGSTFAYLQHNQWDLTSTGLVRFGRAAYAVRVSLRVYRPPS